MKPKNKILNKQVDGFTIVELDRIEEDQWAFLEGCHYGRRSSCKDISLCPPFHFDDDNRDDVPVS